MLKYHIFSIIVEVLLLFYTLFPEKIVASVIVAFILVSIIFLKRRYNWFDSLLIISFYLIPLSFISLIGTDTKGFPIAWFHVVIILLTLLSFVKCKISPQYHIYVGLLSILGFLNCIFQPDPVDAFKQLLVIMLFNFTFYISESVRKNKHYLYPVLLDSFLASTIVLSLQVIIQKYIAEYYGILLGQSASMMNRTAYSGVMGDYSAATLYIATGLMCAIYMYFECKRFSSVMFLVLLSILTWGMLTVTSRTGWVAIGGALALYLFGSRKKISTIQIILFVVVILAAIPYLFDIMVLNRGEEGIKSSSGRLESYVLDLRIFFDNIFWGVGLGLKNLYTKTREGVPHNFFIQYLVQMGIIGTITIIAPFIHFFKLNIKKSDSSKYLFVVVFIGAMFIPDIVSSRFLYGVLILIAASNKYLINYTTSKNEKNRISC